MPPDPAGGASAYVRDTGCCVFPTPVNNPTKSLKAATAAIPRTIPSSNNSSLLSNKFNNNGPSDQDDAGISPPPLYTTIYPPSPPSSAPSSPSSGPVLSGAQNDNSVLPLSPPVSISNGVKAPSVLSTVFPESSAVHSMPSRPVDLSALVPSWKGALLEDTTESNKKTLYVVGGHFDEVNLRDAVCGVLERAEDQLQADAVVIVLEKNQAELSDLLHSLMYVGGTIVAQPALEPNPAFLLVGLDV